MTDRSEASDPGHARSRLSIIVALVVVVGLGALLAWWLKPPPEPVAPAPTVLAPVETTPAPPPPRSSTPPAAPAERPRRRESRPDVKSEPRRTRRRSVARVTSDVAGVFVFLDRKYLGKTPLDTSDVEPGSHHLEVSAEGYDGSSASFDRVLRYQTANQDDAWTLTFGDLEKFALDY